jgi:glutamate N-acetyltransferase/amino-acid N-acetyltransferase
MDIYVPGFMASGISAGIKGNNKKDIALIYSERPSIGVGVFTKNVIKAAPVILSMERIKNGSCQAIIINSGNANACTGEKGYKDALKMAEITAKELGIDERLVLVSSTGVIGKPLKMDLIEKSIPPLVQSLSPRGIPSAAESIMTTDRFTKLSIIRDRIDSRNITICGIAKGAGMIMPNMGTMLAFIMTDIAMEKEILEKIFRSSVGKTFNRINIDGTTSTNDTAIILANGEAKNEIIGRYSRNKNRIAFKKLLLYVLEELTKMIVKDGEGATKSVEIVVKGISNRKNAKKLVYNIANSILIKTAFFGEDPNWGRIMAVIGGAGINILENKIDIYFNNIPIVKGGIYSNISVDIIKDVLKNNSFKVIIDLNNGKSSYSIYTTDLSYEYVRINSEYTT